MLGTSWQRCTVHLMRNALAHVRRAVQRMVEAYMRTVLAQSGQETAKAQPRKAAATLEGRFTKVAPILWECEEDIPAYVSFPEEHHRLIRRTLSKS